MAIANAFTVDVEDWFQLATRRITGKIVPVTDRVVHSTHMLLDILRRARVRATCFILGNVAEAFPQLVRDIQADGHEIGLHGYEHKRVYRMSPEEFRQDLRRTRAVVQAAAPQASIRGHRAAEFSIVKSSLWAIDILIEEGFAYDSSIYPIYHRRYGIPDAPRMPYVIERRGRRLVEFPLTTLDVVGYRLPTAGGGYLRVMPLTLLLQGIDHANAQNRPAVVYMHPYELDPRPLKIGSNGFGLRDHAFVAGQNLFRSRVPRRLHQILKRFSFAPMAEVIDSWMK